MVILLHKFTINTEWQYEIAYHNVSEINLLVRFTLHLKKDTNWWWCLIEVFKKVLLPLIQCINTLATDWWLVTNLSGLSEAMAEFWSLFWWMFFSYLLMKVPKSQHTWRLVICGSEGPKKLFELGRGQQ